MWVFNFHQILFGSFQSWGTMKGLFAYGKQIHYNHIFDQPLKVKFQLSIQNRWRLEFWIENAFFKSKTFKAFLSPYSWFTHESSWFQLFPKLTSWCGILKSYKSFRWVKCHTSRGKGFCVSSPQTRILHGIKSIRAWNHQQVCFFTFHRQTPKGNSKIYLRLL